MFNVGMKKMEVCDPSGLSDIPLLIMYPSRSLPKSHRFGPFEIEVATGARIEPGRFPLIVISHGNGGTPWVHRDLAMSMVRFGAIVAMPEHIGNSKSDNSLEGTKSNLECRPRQFNLCLEKILDSKEFGNSVSKVIAVGHSIGGYTILAAGGAKPYAGPHETASGQVEPIDVPDNEYISSLILMAPATPWFQGADSFDRFNLPVLMITGAEDEITTRFHANIVLDGVGQTAPIIHKVVENAGHFSFQSPFPQQMISPNFPPSQDPPGFDRAQYQTELSVLVWDFIQRN